MYSILQAKWCQYEAFVSALLDDDGDILYTISHGHIDFYWAYPWTNMHSCLLKQLCNSMVKQCNMLSNSVCNDFRIPKSYAPEEIVDTVKMQLQDPLKVSQSNLDSENSLFANNSTFKQNIPSSHGNTDEVDDLSSYPTPTLNSTVSLIGKDINVSVTSQGMQQNQSQKALAQEAVENNRVELVPYMSAFIVQGNNQDL